MSNDNVKPTTERYVSKNLTYLRNSIGLNINELAELLEMDPLILWLYEQPKQQIEFMKANIDFIHICNYFTVKLDLFVLNDLEKENLFSKDQADKLILERTKGIKVYRAIFCDEADDIPAQTENEFRAMLRYIHLTSKINNKIRKLLSDE